MANSWCTYYTYCSLYIMMVHMVYLYTRMTVKTFVVIHSLNYLKLFSFQRLWFLSCWLIRVNQFFYFISYLFTTIYTTFKFTFFINIDVYYSTFFWYLYNFNVIQLDLIVLCSDCFVIYRFIRYYNNYWNKSVKMTQRFYS